MKSIKSSAIVSIICLFLIFIMSCSSHKLKNAQGVYKADTAGLKKILQGKMGTENSFAASMINGIIENALIEIKIEGDTLKGIMKIAGNTTLLKSKITLRNDTLVFNLDSNSERYIMLTPQGCVLTGSSMAMEMVKTGEKDLSKETMEALTRQEKEENEKAEFLKSLGKWQKGNWVDDFGDKTGEAFVYTMVQGSHQTSTIPESDVFVKITFDKGEMYFGIYNDNLVTKETFPRSEYGYMKVKLPSGEVKTERIFFTENLIKESTLNEGETLYNYLQKNEGELKIMIDVGTASEYYSDKYQFSLQRNNLNVMVADTTMN